MAGNNRVVNLNNGAVKRDTAGIKLGPNDAKVVRIEFAKSMINPYVKLFPSPNEVKQKVYLVAKIDPKTGEKIPDGPVSADGYQSYQYEPAKDGAGNTFPVEFNNQNKALPLIIDLRDVNPRVNDRTAFEKAVMSRARVDISLPNDNPESNLRKRNVTIPLAFLKEGTSEKGKTYEATLKPSAYRNGIKVNEPVDPYFVDASGNEVRVNAEMRDYTNDKGITTKKLMVPVGFSNGQPVWDDGKTVIAKAGSEKAASLAAMGKDVVTFDTAVKYHYKESSMSVQDLKKCLESYKSRGGVDAPSYQDAEATKTDEYDGPSM
jgi:hypothetical protein